MLLSFRIICRCHFKVVQFNVWNIVSWTTFASILRVPSSRNISRRMRKTTRITTTYLNLKIKLKEELQVQTCVSNATSFQRKLSLAMKNNRKARMIKKQMQKVAICKFMSYCKMLVRCNMKTYPLKTVTPYYTCSIPVKRDIASCELLSRHARFIQNGRYRIICVEITSILGKTTKKIIS